MFISLLEKKNDVQKVHYNVLKSRTKDRMNLIHGAKFSVQTYMPSLVIFDIPMVIKLENTDSNTNKEKEKV